VGWDDEDTESDELPEVFGDCGDESVEGLAVLI
jgi:hypothetical protein